MFTDISKDKYILYIDVYIHIHIYILYIHCTLYILYINIHTCIFRCRYVGLCVHLSIFIYILIKYNTVEHLRQLVLNVKKSFGYLGYTYTNY